MKHKHGLVKLITVLTLFFTNFAALGVVAGTNTQEVSASTRSQKCNAVVKLAKQQVGKSYVYGATGPTAFDCSGLVKYVYKKAGQTILPRTTYLQVTIGKKVSLKHLKKGDLLFWGNANSPYHVGIYVGKNQFVHAATPSQGVKKQTISTYFYPTEAERVL